MTGANFGVAETGDIVVCTNEGNADMSTSIPRLQISAIGLEKIVPDCEALSVFVRLLARSATGQPSTVYTSHFRKARPGADQMHIVIVDNGRSKWLADPEHWETLKCIRCGSCMNTCPVYRWSGRIFLQLFHPWPARHKSRHAPRPTQIFRQCQRLHALPELPVHLPRENQSRGAGLHMAPAA